MELRGLKIEIANAFFPGVLVEVEMLARKAYTSVVSMEEI